MGGAKGCMGGAWVGGWGGNGGAWGVHALRGGGGWGGRSWEEAYFGVRSAPKKCECFETKIEQNVFF